MHGCSFTSTRIRPRAYGKDELEWSIINAEGDTLRNGALTADGGIQTMRWRFDTNGMDWPQRELKKKKDEPSGGGPDVLPGTYTLAMNLGIMPALRQ